MLPSFPNSIWERNCQRNSIADPAFIDGNQREMEFREEQGTFPSATWEREEQ
jgi:hypothetical protein